MWRSEPHIAQDVTLMIASRGSSIFGSGTSSQRMSALPCQVRAFMGPPLYEIVGGRAAAALGGQRDNDLAVQAAGRNSDFPSFLPRCSRLHAPLALCALRRGADDE